MERRAPVLELGLAVVLLAITLATFAPVASYPFIRLDDPGYVVDNPHVRAGLTWAGMRWALTTYAMGNWHPVTWWSHMLDIHLFGLDAGRHHLMSLGLHGLSAVALFAMLRRLTGSRWRSAAVAALFAVHPLRLESVVWIAERKDVLGALFGWLAVLAWVAWTRRHGFGRYALALGLFALSLGAKPMLVTLPFLLLLLDYWPLERLCRRRDDRPSLTVLFQGAIGLLPEKLPFIGLSLASATITFVAQRAGGAVSDTESLPLLVRVGNAALSYLRYLGKLAWPAELSIFYSYPSPEAWTGWLAGISLLSTAGLPLTVWAAWRFRPRWVVVGWLWFLGTLVPVIGLVQVGRQAMADRYTYVPSVGIYLLVVWGAAHVARRWESRAPARLAIGLAFAGMLVATAAATRHQLGYWRDSVTLFSRGLEVSPAAATLHNNLGIERGLRGEMDAALHHFQRAAELAPNDPEPHFNAGRLLADRGRYAEALAPLERAAALRPDRAEPHFHLGLAWRGLGRPELARGSLRRAVQLRPNWVAALTQTAWLLATGPSAERPEVLEAITLAERAAELTGRQDPFALDTLAAAHAAAGSFEEAIAWAERSLSLLERARAEPTRVQAVRDRLEHYRRGEPFRTRP